MSDWRERIGERRVVASVSGGKDSAALSLWLTEQGIDHDRVFMDTGWEHPATYEYLRGELARVLGPITEVRSAKYPGGFPNLVVARGMFPSRTRRFCTDALKMQPLAEHLGRLMDAGADVVSATGIRAAESEARARMPEWEWSKGLDCEVWRPLLRWSEDDVIAIHTRHGLAPNPMYLRGARRVGCWPCIFSRKDEIRFMAETDPKHIEFIGGLESIVQQIARERQERAGTYGQFHPPTMFQAPGALRSEGEDGRMVPIDEVVEWARTAHGGRQFELFAPEREEGCVRWGLCETEAA